MSKRREALEAYRKARAGGATPPKQVAPTSPRLSSITSKHQIQDPVAYAAKNCAAWIAANDAAHIKTFYTLLMSPGQRKQVISWAIGRARAGDLDVLLYIGIEDANPAVQKHLDNMLNSVPADAVLESVRSTQLSAKERRTVAGLLGRSDKPEAAHVLASMASDSDARVREAAVQSLIPSVLSPDRKLAIFKKRIEQDREQDVRLRAAEGLAALGTTEAIATLQRAADESISTPGIQACYAAWQAAPSHRASAAAQPTGELPAEPVPAAPSLATRLTPALVLKILVVVVLVGFAGYRIVKYVRQRSAWQYTPRTQQIQERRSQSNRPPKPGLSEKDKALHIQLRDRPDLYRQMTGRTWESDAQ